MASAAPPSSTGPARNGLHPLHLVLLASTLPLFLGALLSDWAYAATDEIQWLNFAAWLIAGGLVFAGPALVWALIDLFRADVRRSPARRLYAVLLASAVIVAFVNALVHAKDAWATMPEGLVLSVVTLLLVLASLWLVLGARVPGAGR